MKKLVKNRHKYLAIFWVIMAIPTILWWKESVLWIAIFAYRLSVEASLAAMEAQKGK